MKKSVLLIAFLVSSIAFSQQSDFWKNVRFGGGLGLNFGDVTTISVSPAAVYEFKGGFSLGAGLNYTHNSASGGNSANIYGGSLISLYNVPVVNLQLSGEFEQSFVNTNVNGVDSSYSQPAMYLGIAYRGLRGLSFGFRYDVLHDNQSIYSSAITPIVRVFF